MKLKYSFHPYALFTIIIWSLAYVFSRLALQHFSIYSLGFLRYFLASCVLLILMAAKRMKFPDKKDIKWFLLAGAAGFFLYMIAFNKGCETVSSSTGSLVMATVPIITAVLARILLKERLKALQWIAIAVSFTGVVVLTVLSGGISVNIGILWLIIASVLLSAYNLFQRKLTKKYPALQTTAFCIFSGTLMLAVFAPASVGELVDAAPNHIFYVAFLGLISSAIAYVAWAKAYALAKQTSSVSNYMFLTPFLTSISGLLIAKEQIELPAVIGGIIIVAGLALFNFGEMLTKKHVHNRNL